MMMKDYCLRLSLVGLSGGLLFGSPPDTPPQTQGQAPKNPQKATPLCHKGIDGGMFFLPLRWTERIDDCRANAMVVPIGCQAFNLLMVIK
jgi:hypothetical protein